MNHSAITDALNSSARENELAAENAHPVTNKEQITNKGVFEKEPTNMARRSGSLIMLIIWNTGKL